MMTPSEWLSLIALILTFIVGPLIALAIKVNRIEATLTVLMTNHIQHLQNDVDALGAAVRELGQK